MDIFIILLSITQYGSFCLPLSLVYGGRDVKAKLSRRRGTNDAFQSARRPHGRPKRIYYSLLAWLGNRTGRYRPGNTLLESRSRRFLVNYHRIYRNELNSFQRDSRRATRGFVVCDCEPQSYVISLFLSIDRWKSSRGACDWIRNVGECHERRKKKKKKETRFQSREGFS